MSRIYHPYWNWEDYKAGAWASTCADPDMLQKAIEFTGNAKLYGQYMLKVADEWPITCEHHLTDESHNRRAWIGHAACAMAIGCPEHVTRQAWGHLTEQQRIEANGVADVAIGYWEFMNAQKDRQLHFELEEEGLCA